jgi:hypothetical protein
MKLPILQKAIYALSLTKLWFSLSLPVFAQEKPKNEAGGWFKGINCIFTGNCQANDLVQFLVNLVNWMLDIAGALALFFLCYGGWIWITSGGEEEKVKKGHETILQAVVGIALVLAAWVGVSFILTEWLGLEVSSGMRIQLKP